MKKLHVALIVWVGLSAWGPAADIARKVDGKDFMSQHDLVWDEIPLR